MLKMTGGLASEWDDFLVGLTLSKIDGRDVSEMRFEDVVRALSAGLSRNFPRADRQGVAGRSVATLTLTFVGESTFAGAGGAASDQSAAATAPSTEQTLSPLDGLSPRRDTAVQSVPFAEWNDWDEDELTASVTSNFDGTAFEM